jgi:hypothetical protein
MRALVLLVVSLCLSACVAPQYGVRLVPLISSPRAPQQQAIAICRPKAELALQNVRSSAQAYQDSRNSQAPTSYNCSTSGTYGSGHSSSNTNCSPHQMVSVNPYGSAQANAAGTQAGDAVLLSCLAEYGWGVERYCVDNCM